MANVRLPGVYVDAKELLESFLESGRLVLGDFHTGHSRLCTIEHFHMATVDEEDEEGYANISLSVSYNLPMLGVNSFALKTRKLRVLNTLGDTKWTYRTIRQIWDGFYPTSVAVDEENGDVFFINLRMEKVELVYFGVMTKSELDFFLFEISEREPFEISIDKDAMFQFIDGGEGINHLRDNIMIELRCGVPITVRPALTSEGEKEDDSFS